MIRQNRPVLACGSAAAGLLALATIVGADIGFTPAPTLQTPTTPSGAAIADFNRDGRADLAVASDTPDRISVFFGNGDGTFGAPLTILTGDGSGPESLIAADINGDGAADLVVALHNVNSVQTFINTGAGAFTPASTVTTGANPHSLTAADLDGDGDVDFVTANRDGDSITLIRNTGVSLSAVATIATGGQEPRGVAVGDFNGNGIMDLAVSNHRSRSVTILSGAGSFTYSVTAMLAVLPDTRPDGIAAGDFDGNGDMDLAIAISEQPAINVIGIYANTAGTFSGPLPFNTGGLNPSRVLVRDFDLDGKADVAVANEDSGNLSVLRNTSGGTISFAPAAVFATGAHPEQFAAGDLDGNGSPDLAVPNRDSNTTSILMNAAAAPCRADADGNGRIEPADVSMFVSIWFTSLQSGSLAGDYDRNGAVEPADVSLFVNHWFAALSGPCPI